MPRPTGTKSKFLSILKKKEISSRSLIKVSNSRPDAWHGHGTLEKSLSKLYPQKQWSRFVPPTSAAGISVRYKKRCQKSFLLSSQEGKFCRCQFLSGCSSILKPWTVVWRLVERTGTFQLDFFQLDDPDFVDLDNQSLIIILLNNLQQMSRFCQKWDKWMKDEMSTNLF